VIGTGQDEWYNVTRGLRALYDCSNPGYFIHPALYYELLALLYGIQRLVLYAAGSVGAGADFLDYFLVHEGQFVNVARSASVGSGALAVLAAVWLGAVLSGAGAGLLSGVIVASLPLLQVLATTVRVDALGLAAWLAATALVVRWDRCPERRTLVAASAGIGVAAAANYPGALLLALLAWFEWARPGHDDLARRASRVAKACAVAFAVFILLNPYVIIDFGSFVAWFTFQARLPLLVHPHAEEPSVTRYLFVIRDQDLPVVLACVAGVAAITRPRQPSGAVAALGLAYLAAFSVMRTQYDRFVLPAIALLAIAGASWIVAQLARRLGRRAASAVAIAAALLVVGFVATRPVREHAEGGPDYRAAMFAWIAEHVPPTATLVLESDTLPLLQTVYDPGDQDGRFQASLRAAFQKRYPDLIRNVVKVQLIAAVYNYDPKRLESGNVFFLASSQNREFIGANRTVLAQPAAFYEVLDARAAVVHQTGGLHEALLLYATR